MLNVLMATAHLILAIGYLCKVAFVE